ncbi:MAG: hypothetical protein AAGD22_00090 [Verrucomicrobiota bacterium]
MHFVCEPQTSGTIKIESRSKAAAPPIPAAPAIVLAIGLSVLLAGCGASEHEMTVTQSLGDRERRVKVGATSDERFQDRRLPTMASTDDSAPVENPLRWETPEGWTELDATQMRVINLRFGPNGEGECYLTVLPGAGGGVAENINRWAGQMGLEPLTRSELDALPSLEMFGRPAPIADFQGTYGGMGNIEPMEGARMLGAVLADSQMTFFVKMVGPSALVDSERENFDRFCGSLRIVTEG